MIVVKQFSPLADVVLRQALSAPVPLTYRTVVDSASALSLAVSGLQAARRTRSNQPYVLALPKMLCQILFRESNVPGGRLSIGVLESQGPRYSVGLQSRAPRFDHEAIPHTEHLRLSRHARVKHQPEIFAAVRTNQRTAIVQRALSPMIYRCWKESVITIPMVPTQLSLPRSCVNIRRIFLKMIA